MKIEEMNKIIKILEVSLQDLEKHINYLEDELARTESKLTWQASIEEMQALCTTMKTILINHLRGENE